VPVHYAERIKSRETFVADEKPSQLNARQLTRILAAVLAGTSATPGCSADEVVARFGAVLTAIRNEKSEKPKKTKGERA
jgi:hypothetical protein